ncbi:ubiquinol-cytochrome c reductase iron-sulfur subunit [Salinarchaeum chitinilyticum]
MDDPYDKYPEDTDRRRFVKGVVGAGALSGVIGASASMVDSLTAPPGAGGGPTDYMGIEQTGGPAPRGMPQIPLEYDDEGNLKGIWPEVEMQQIGGQTVPIAEMELGGTLYSTTWYQYCGSQNNPAIEPDADLDNTIRYTANPAYEWQSNQVEAGDPVRAEHFSDYENWGNVIGESGVGKPAKVTWRSTELEPRDRLPVQLIRSPLIEQAAEDNDWLQASTVDGFIAIHNQCTHFCCVPGYKDPGQTDAMAYGAGDSIYCQCHQSVYDPFTIIEQDFIALPRSD